MKRDEQVLLLSEAKRSCLHNINISKDVILQLGYFSYILQLRQMARLPPEKQL